MYLISPYAHQVLESWVKESAPGCDDALPLIYLRKYFTPLHLGDFPLKVAFFLFDTAILHGSRAAIDLMEMAKAGDWVGMIAQRGCDDRLIKLLNKIKEVKDEQRSDKG